MDFKSFLCGAAAVALIALAMGMGGTDDYQQALDVQAHACASANPPDYCSETK